MRFVPNQGDNHAVEVEEKQDKVEAKFDERFLAHVLEIALKRSTWGVSDSLMHVQLAEDLRRIEKMLVIEDSECHRMR